MANTPNRDFDPEAVKVLVDAYTAAVNAVGLPQHPVGNLSGTQQWTIALGIMDLALLGETNPERLLAAGMRGAGSEEPSLGSPGPMPITGGQLTSFWPDSRSLSVRNVQQWRSGPPRVH